MAALKKSKIVLESKPEAAVAADTIRVVAQDHALEPIASPAHELQQALRDAGYRSEAFQDRPMSNAMLVLTLVCVYALAMMMLLGSISA